MATREELMRGIVRVNNEEQNREDAPPRSSPEVSGDASGGESKQTDQLRTHGASAARSVSGPERSLEEELKARQRESIEELERVTWEIGCLQDRRIALELDIRILSSGIKQMEEMKRDRPKRNDEASDVRSGVSKDIQ